MNSILKIKNLKKTYHNKDGETLAVKNFTFNLNEGEFIAIVGPSGCGKSTTLRMIAGVEEVTSGELLIGDRVVNNVAPKDRDIAWVFHTYALYPHITGHENIALTLEVKGKDKKQVDDRVI